MKETRQALVLSIEVWEWLLNNPDREKAEWPGWDEKNPGYYKEEKICNECFLCEVFIGGLTGNRCEDCPLYVDCECGNDDHPYSVYTEAHWNEDRDIQCEAAEEILFIMKQALLEINK